MSGQDTNAFFSLVHADDTSDLVVWTVIEGSTIIIACSIPILQPLLEKILRRNPFASTAKKSHNTTDNKYYEDRTSSRTYELGVRKPHAKAKDEAGFTVLADDGDSEEGILAMDTQTQYQQSTHIVSDRSPANQYNQNFSFQNKPLSPVGHQHRGAGPANIMRTDTVTVSFDRTNRA